MKRVLVTGGNKGIGLAVCRKLLVSHPDVVVLLGSRDAARGRAAIDDLLKDKQIEKNRVELVEIDVANELSIRNAAAAVAKEFGSQSPPLYGIINNAGILGGSTQETLQVNFHGPRMVVEQFLPLLQPQGGRIVNVSSGSGPIFVAACSPEIRSQLTDPAITYDQLLKIMSDALSVPPDSAPESYAALGFGSAGPMFAYGLSKACLTAYTLLLARQYPALVINACTPGFIETDLTRPIAAAQGKKPEELGMKSPDAGSAAPVLLMMGDITSSGWYYGSDCQRSPLDRYRNPGSGPWYRAAGWTYLRYANVCADLLRNVLKEPLKAKAIAARGNISYRFTPYNDGKAGLQTVLDIKDGMPIKSAQSSS